MLTLCCHAGARDRAGPGSRGATSAEASGSEAEGDEEVRLLGGSGAAAPERDDEFEAELAALVLKHQGRAPPAPAPVRVRHQLTKRYPVGVGASPDGGWRRHSAQAGACDCAGYWACHNGHERAMRTC